MATSTAIAHGFIGSTEVFTQTLALTATHQLIALNFMGIDKWTLTNQTNNTLIDDICVNDAGCAGAASVPNPAAAALVALAVAAVVTRRRLTT